MKKLHEDFPVYNWNSNKGYGTPEHRHAIEKHGLCEFHRRSFNIISAQLHLDFGELCEELNQDIPVEASI